MGKITNTATARDFQLWARKAKQASIDSLNYVIEDCRLAAEAMGQDRPERMGYYLDQMYTYADERARRVK